MCTERMARDRGTTTSHFGPGAVCSGVMTHKVVVASDGGQRCGMLVTSGCGGCSERRLCKDPAFRARARVCGVCRAMAPDPGCCRLQQLA